MNLTTLFGLSFDVAIHYHMRSSSWFSGSSCFTEKCKCQATSIAEAWSIRRSHALFRVSIQVCRSLFVALAPAAIEIIIGKPKDDWLERISYLIIFCLVCLVLSYVYCFILLCLALPCLALSHLILSYLIIYFSTIVLFLFHFVLFYLILSYLILS